MNFSGRSAGVVGRRRCLRRRHAYQPPYRQPNAKNAAAPTALLFGTICRAVLPCRCFPSLLLPWWGAAKRCVKMLGLLYVCFMVHHVLVMWLCCFTTALSVYPPPAFWCRRGLSMLNESMHSKRNWWSFRAGWSICNRLCRDIIFGSHTKMLSYCPSLSFASLPLFFLVWQLHRQLHQVLFRRMCKQRGMCVQSLMCGSHYWVVGVAQNRAVGMR